MGLRSLWTLALLSSAAASGISCATRRLPSPTARTALLRLRGGVQELQSEEEWEEIRSRESRLIVLDFSAVWCGPCQRIAPVYQELAEEYCDNALLLKVDVDDLPELAAQLGVSSMPTFLFFKHGEKVDTLRGANEEALREMLLKHVAV
jgi:thioredoxin